MRPTGVTAPRQQVKPAVSPLTAPNMTTGNWSKAISYDLARTSWRASVPPHLTHVVPETPGTYAILRIGTAEIFDAILDIGECGPRANSTPHGLRGRLASDVPHSASKNIADDLRNGILVGPLSVVWVEMFSKDSAKDLQDALITLFRDEYGKQPRYNRKRENHSNPVPFIGVYQQLKTLTGRQEVT